MLRQIIIIQKEIWRVEQNKKYALKKKHKCNKH